jgi:hypothetical protein
MADAFQPRFVDLVRNYTITQGTGAFVLGPPVPGFTSFASAVQPGDQFYYSAIGVDKPNEREVGRGTLQADGSIARSPIGGAATSFTGGSKTVALIAAAEWFNNVQSGAAAGGGTPTCATRTALSAATTGQAPVQLTEAGREGTFLFDSSNLSAKVGADPMQAIYVAPVSDPTGASGAWVRGAITSLRPEWFGADPTGVADSLPAINAMLAYIAFENRNGSAFYRGARECLFAGASYFFSDTIDIKSTVHWRGFGSGGAGGLATKLRWPASKAGIRIQRYDTVGENGAGTASTGGDGSIIEGFYLESGGGPVDLLKAGIWLRGRAFVRDCRIAGFPGPGTLVYASVGGTGAAYGNANGWELSNLRIEGCKSGGHYCTGSDANAGKATLLDVANCGQYGIYDSCFLANTFDSCQVASCGFGGSAGLNQTSIVSDGSYRYQLIHGQDANGGKTAPTAGTSNSVWGLQGPGGVSGTLIPLYSSYVASGGTFVSGGSYYISNANAEHALIGCYHESGQADPWIDAPAVSIGGSLATSRNRGTGTIAGGTGGGLTTQSLIGVNAKDAANVSRTYQFGETGAPLTAVSVSHATYAPLKWRTGFGVNGGANYPEDLWTHYNNVPVEKLSGPSTNEQYGRGAVQPYYRHAVNFALGPYNNGGARVLTYGSAAPAAGAKGTGEIVFNNRTLSTKEILWSNSAAGSPGTWEALYRRLYGSAVYDPPSLTAGAQQSTSVTVIGAAVGDIVGGVSFSSTLSGTRMWGEVTGANTVTVYHRNDTGGTLDIGSGTLRVEVAKQ